MRACFRLILTFCLCFSASGEIPAAPAHGQSQGGPGQSQGGPGQSQTSDAASSIRPEEVNVHIKTDARVFTMMAALNIAGDEDGSGGAASWRPQMEWRRHLASLDQPLQGRLRNYYAVHLAGRADRLRRIGGYVGLSLVMSPPPAFSITMRRESLPGDVIDAIDLAPLIREFYARTDVAQLIRPTLGQYQDEIRAAQQQIGQMIFQTLQYLHTIPVLTITEQVIPEEKQMASPNERKKDKPPRPRTRQRTRRLFVLLNPLDATDTVYIRNDILNGADTETERLPGDDYFIVLSSLSNLNPIRLAFLRFVLEPLSERFAISIRQQAVSIGHLAEQVVGAEAMNHETAFSIVNESLARAVEARLERVKLQRQWEQPLSDARQKRRHAQSPPDKRLAEEQLERLRQRIQEEERIADEDVIHQLSAHYERGAVLAFHFYEKLIPWERAGVDIAVFYQPMLESINFQREATRADAYREVRARVETRREARRKAAAPVSEIVQKLEHANDLIQKREFEQARPLLEGILKERPNNARAHYGLAQVISQAASQIDPNQSPDPDAAWEQLTTQLELAVEHYRRAIATASRPEEAWLISQAHVAIGRVLEFTGQEEEAQAEYRKAVDLGDVPGGAYAQAKARLENRQ